MTGYRRHVLVCTNVRPPENPKGCCSLKGSEEVLLRFKQEIAERGLKAEMRATASGCLDYCQHGITVVVYPEGTWYSRVTADDVREIVEEHLVGGRAVGRLLMPADAARG